MDWAGSDQLRGCSRFLGGALFHIISGGAVLNGSAQEFCKAKGGLERLACQIEVGDFKFDRKSILSFGQRGKFIWCCPGLGNGSQEHVLIGGNRSQGVEFRLSIALLKVVIAKFNERLGCTAFCESPSIICEVDSPINLALSRLRIEIKHRGADICAGPEYRSLVGFHFVQLIVENKGLQGDYRDGANADKDQSTRPHPYYSRPIGYFSGGIFFLIAGGLFVCYGATYSRSKKYQRGRYIIESLVSFGLILLVILSITQGKYLIFLASADRRCEDVEIKPIVIGN